jgi:hypothetical protein
MIIAVCGDSYMSPDIKFPGSHFSEILAKEFHADLIVLSKPGMSNGGIAMTLESVLNIKPDLLLVGTTFSDRIEFPLKHDDGSRRLFNADDIAYRNSFRGNVQDPKFVSTNLAELLADDVWSAWPDNFIDVVDAEEKLLTIRAWFKNIYHSGWKQQVDQYIIYAMLHQIYLSDIPCLLCVDYVDVAHRVSWFDKNLIAVNAVLPVGRLIGNAGDIQRSYHTSAKTQESIFKAILPMVKHMVA